MPAIKPIRRQQRRFLSLGNDPHRAVTLAQRAVLQAVQAHLEPHQLRRADLVHDLIGARDLVLAH